MTEVSAATVAAHPFLRGMSRDQVSVLAEAARDVKFPARYRLFEDGGNATRFWLIQSGHVSLDLHVPGEGPVVIETIGMGELLGFDAPLVRERCAAHPELGYEFNQRITQVLARRLQATRIRLLARSGHSAAVH
jgi:CRP/FNR family cyclic AMP-dependent transcriptional regulator